MKWLDLPPLWLALMIALAWGQATVVPLGLHFPGAWVDGLAVLLVLGGLGLTALALLEFRKHRTTPIPHQSASHLIDSGIFARTRNPIYLGDALILTGAILWLDAVLSLILIPLFVLLIQRRFILPEEERLARSFPAPFQRYVERVRRWI